MSTIAGTVVGGVAAVIVVQTILSSWPEVRRALSGSSLGWLSGALFLAGLAMLSMAWGWRRVLAIVGFAVPAREVTTWYFLGEIGKYLPGGVWPVVGRGELASRSGIPRTRAYLSVALSLAMLYLAAMCTAVIFLPFAVTDGGVTPWMLFLLTLPVGLILLHHEVLLRLVALAGRLTRRPLQVEVPAWGQSLVAMGSYIPSWLLVGASTFAVARAFTPDASWPRLAFAAILSWIVGFLIVPVPSGAGVREAVLLVTSGLPAGLAAATAVTTRLLFVAVDAIGAAIAAWTAMRRRPLPDSES